LKEKRFSKPGSARGLPVHLGVERKGKKEGKSAADLKRTESTGMTTSGKPKKGKKESPWARHNVEERGEKKSKSATRILDEDFRERALKSLQSGKKGK